MRRRVGPLLRFPIESCNQFSTDVELMRVLLISATFLLPLATCHFLPLRIPKHAGARIIGIVIKTKFGTENRGVMFDLDSSFLFVRLSLYLWSRMLGRSHVIVGKNDCWSFEKLSYKYFDGLRLFSPFASSFSSHFSLSEHPIWIHCVSCW